MSFEELVTKQDLAEVKKVLDEIRELTSIPAPEWIRTDETLKLLGCKNDYLNRLRGEGRIKSVKIGSIVYYNIQSFYDHLDSISRPVRAA